MNSHKPGVRLIATKGDTAQRPLGRGVVDLDAPVLDVAGQRWPARQAVSSGLGQF
jgi:hypothetical protein